MENGVVGCRGCIYNSEDPQESIKVHKVKQD